MNSDLMPSPEPENLNVSSQSENESVANEENTDAAVTPEPENALDSVPDNPSESSSVKSDTDSDGSEANRQHPIPPPSEPMQYRAIGLVRGRYLASSEQFTQGTLLTPDGTELNSVLLGRIMSLVKNHLDLEKDHLWVVYPRTRQENESLHVQIVGVWEPENLAKAAKEGLENDESQSADSQTDEDVENNTQEETTNALASSSELPDGSFSVRGEVVYQSYEPPSLVIKIKQQPRKKDDKPKYFKLKLLGKMEGKVVGKFFDFQAKREEDKLVIEGAKFIAELPKKRRPPFSKSGGPGGRRPFNRGGGGASGPGSQKPYRKPAPGSPTPRPIKKPVTGDAGSSRPPAPPNPNRPVPKPIKKPKGSEEG